MTWPGAENLNKIKTTAMGRSTMPRCVVVESDSADTCNDGALRSLTVMVVLVAAICTCVTRRLIVGETTLLSSVVIAAAMKTSIGVVAERDISVLPTLNARVLGFVAPNTPSPLPC